MSEESMDWRDFDGFRSVDLAASYVLSWAFDGDTLALDLDLCLTEDHPFYESPADGEAACIRPAVLEFPHCGRLAVGEREAKNTAIRTLAEELSHGRIIDFECVRDGVYRVVGRFGEARIDAERPILRLPSGND